MTPDFSYFAYQFTVSCSPSRLTSYWKMSKITVGPDKKIGSPIPPYYQDLSEFLDKNSDDFRVFMTPMWSVEIPIYLWKDTIYYGADPALFLLNQPAIATNLQGFYSYDFISYMRRYMQRFNLAPALSLLRVKIFDR